MDPAELLLDMGPGRDSEPSKVVRSWTAAAFRVLLIDSAERLVRIARIGNFE